MTSIDDERKPAFVHCPTCQHEWVAIWLPMDADKAARVLRGARICPMCAAGGTRMGRYPHEVGRSPSQPVTVGSKRR
jgi:hypothetical protein